MKFTCFKQVIDYLERFTNLEKDPSLYSSQTYRLDRMRKILSCIGNPQNSYMKVHVAGSKGKGSTSSFIACGIKAAGHKCGLYMSPHVSDYRERFTIAGEFIADEDLISCGEELSEKLKDFTYNNNPTTFELFTAFAFLLFKRLGCDYAVIETGLGGRLDATNTIDSIACVFTPVELEHTQLLGNTICAIATEKSKIIKSGVPVFVNTMNEDAIEVFSKEAKENKCAFFRLDENISDFESHIQNNRQYLKVKYTDGFEAELKLKMLGLVQSYNCALSIMVLRHFGLFCPATIKALEENTIPGRMETINWKRTLYIDGAHTEHSIQNLVNTFRELYPGKEGVCIFGSVSDKNHTQMAKIILSSFDNIVICRPGTFKPSNVQELYELVKKLSDNQNIVLREKSSDALSWCLENTTEQTPVLVCGSFYLAGCIKEALNELK